MAVTPQTLPEATTGVVRNLKKTTLFLRIPKTRPTTGPEAYERINLTVPLPPNVDVEIYWEDFLEIQAELEALQLKKFIRIIRYPHHLYEPLEVQVGNVQITPWTTVLDFEAAGTLNIVGTDMGAGKASILISSSGSMTLRSPVDPAEAATIGGKLVRFNGTWFKKAIANSPINSQAIGIAHNVDLLTNTAEIYFFGVTPDIPGLVNETRYYLSQTVPGEMTSTMPMSGIILPVGTSYSAANNQYFLDIDQPENGEFVEAFGIGDWFSTDAGDLWSVDILHSLGILFPRTTIYDTAADDQVLVHRVRIIDANTLRISVCQEGTDGRFVGAIVIGR